MTRIAIIGTSNIGALKSAAPEIARDWPDINVTFYGLPGGRFHDAHVDPQGRFGPARSDARALALADRINGMRRIPLAEFDHVLVIADAMGMAAILHMALSHDVAEWDTRRETTPLMSEAAFVRGAEAAVAERVDHLATQLRDIRPVTVFGAPYPATDVTQPGEHYQEPYALVPTHPEAARIERVFHAAGTATLDRHGMAYRPQPPETVASPFLTRPEFALGAEDFRSPGTRLKDRRHMNARYGASLFRAFALGLAPTDGADPNGAGQTQIYEEG